MSAAMGLRKSLPARSIRSMTWSSRGVPSFQLGACSRGIGRVVSSVGQRSALAGRQHQPERGLGDVPGDPVGTIGGRDDDRPQLGVGQGLELGGEAIDCPAVADAPVVVELREREAEPERGRLPRLAELRLESSTGGSPA